LGDIWKKIQIFEPGEKIFEFFVDKGLEGI